LGNVAKAPSNFTTRVHRSPVAAEDDMMALRERERKKKRRTKRKVETSPQKGRWIAQECRHGAFFTGTLFATLRERFYTTALTGTLDRQGRLPSVLLLHFHLLLSSPYLVSGRLPSVLLLHFHLFLSSL
jgi:hypothetical protein